MSVKDDVGGMATEVATRDAIILVVEDEALFAKAVVRRLEKSGYTTRQAGTLSAAAAALDEAMPDLVLLDMRLPDGSGLDFLQRLRERSGVPVIVMTAYGEVDDAVTAMKFAASDYLKKPLDLDELEVNVEKVLAASALNRQLEYSRARESNRPESVRLLGDSPAFERVREQIERIAGLAAAGDVPPTVLITGETGSGKDVTARLLHQASARASRPFVHVDCAALPKDLIEAELFGHVKGAFTSAVAERTGLIEAAEDGVVFLDEIGEIPLELQAKLLAVLERRSLRRLGSSRELRTRAWFVAATNRPVEDMVAAGTLRSDLYFRLKVLTVELPPLRERGGDALVLAEHFAADVARRYGIANVALDADARALIERYEWPGNVRELSHVIERAVLLSTDGRVDARALGLGEVQPGADAPGSGLEALDGMTLEDVEQMMLARALEITGDNVSEAARRLGITRMAMRYRMQKYGLRGS